MYIPRDFGAFALYQSVIAFFGVLATCRYELAIVVAREQKEAEALFAGCLLITGILTGCAVLMVLVLFRSPKAPESLLGSLYPVRWLIPMGLCANGIYQACAYFRNRERDFHRLSISAVGLQIGSVVFAITCGYLGWQSIGLSSGAVAGQIAAICCLQPGLASFRRWLPDRSAGLQAVLNCLQQYKRFAVYNVPCSMIGYLSVGVPVALLLHFGFTTDAGFFSMARRLLYLPATLLGVSLSQVIYEQAAGSIATDRFANLFRSLLTTIGQLGAVLFVFFCVWAPLIIPSALGRQWEPSIPIMIIFAPCGFAFLNASWIDRLYDAAGMQHRALRLLAISTALSAFLFYGMSIAGFKPLYTIGCYSALITIYYLYYTFVISRLVGKSGVPLWGIVKASGIEAVSAALVFGLVRITPVEPHIGLAISVAILLLAIIWRLRHAARNLRLISVVVPT
jgi:O-antigen/teichoic acid export membrane protein